ncbi:alpha/beta fold hydrolase [Herbiconiux ginsengi]|uniref:Pimeloyl-ACP methyl ester carboxylesterase n=1 Tax=Herbiconiux ginsengi TaxID=381665 RepID=A0A1H3LEC0_9MICO|nr:alpha/beta fold hydrolase [Herbiconiux ginsengi]SDY62731.1 Pimeloyl-ACP methyl ester carboxylesterase [Herbiconiux ginsengi]
MTRPDATEAVVHAGREHGNDAPFVIVPGIGMSHRYSIRLHDELARTATVLSLDLPGFGDRPKPAGPMSVPDYARVVAQALDDRQTGRVVLIGHSMGAQFSVELARRRPGLVERLVLVAPVADPHRRTTLQQSLDLLHDLVLETPSAAAIVTADYLRTGPRWFFAEVRALLAYRTEEAIAGVACPVLVMRGENDPIARRGWCYDLAHRAADGRLVEIDKAAHVPQHTATHHVARAILAFTARDAYSAPR